MRLIDGVPCVHPPATRTEAAQKATKAAVEEIVTQQYDDGGNPCYKLELLTTGGAMGLRRPSQGRTVLDSSVSQDRDRAGTNCTPTRAPRPGNAPVQPRASRTPD